MEGDSGSVSGHNANTGRTPATVVFNGKLYVFSYDESNGNLRMAKSSTGYSGWQFSVLDGAGGSNGRINGNVGKTPSVVVYSNSIQLFYYASTGGNLRHAWSGDGTNWNFETLDGAGGSNGRINGSVGQTSAVTVYRNSLQVFYRSETNGDLRHAWTTPTQGWQFETLDGAGGGNGRLNGNVGSDPAAISWSNNELHVFYRDEDGKRMRRAWTTPSQPWQFQNLDGDVGSLCGQAGNYGQNLTHPAAAIYSNSLQVFYYEAGNGDLRHAWKGSSGNWNCEDLEGSPGAALGYDYDVGSMPAVVVNSTDMQLFAFEPRYEDLRHYWTSTTSPWQSEYFDGRGGNPAGRLNHKLGLDPAVTYFGGTYHVFYYDHTNGDLRHAWAQ